MRIIDHGLSPAPFIVMEHFSGIPLSKWIKANGAMHPKVAIDLFLQLCDALSAAEALRIVHRDLKPANILLKSSNDGIQCKILDFGLAKLIDMNSAEEKLTSTGEILGSPAYMSPEQWKGQADNRSDLYALGCIMYEMLAGKPPFSGQFGMEYMSKHLSEQPQTLSISSDGLRLPSGLECVINKCMQKSPANRYQSSSECSADLKKLKQGLKLSISLPEQIRTRRLRNIIAAISVSLVALLGSCAWMASQQKPEEAKLAPMPMGMHPRAHFDKWQNKNLSQWSEAIQKNPLDPELYYNRARLHVARDERKEALHDLGRALKLKPDYADAYVGRSNLYTLVNDFDNALADANKAIALRPTWCHGYNARAYVYQRAEQSELAIADCNKALELGELGCDYEPSNSYVFCNLSLAYLSLGRFDKANKTIERGLKIAPQKFRWLLYRQRAMVHYLKHEFASAINDLNQATKVINSGPSAWSWIVPYNSSLRGFCLSGLGKTAEAQEAALQGLKDETDPAAAYRRRAELWRSAGQPEKAIQDYSMSISLASDYFMPFRGRALCYLQQGQLADALADLEEAASMNPSSAKTLSLLAMVEDKLGKTEKAEQDLARAFALPTHPPIAFVSRASIELNAGKSKEALDDLDHAISLNPYLKEAYAMRGQVNEKLGRVMEAKIDLLMSHKLVTHAELYP